MSDARARALAAFDGLVAKPARRKAAAPRAVAAPAEPRVVRVVVTPADFDRRVDRMGRPYAWIRGTVTHRKVERTRTVMAQGEAYHLVQHLLGIGTAIQITAMRDTVVDRDTGARGGEFYRALDVLKVYDAEGREIDGATGRVLAQHDRVGHYRRQHHGPANTLVKIVWIDETKVNAGRLAA